MRDWEKLEEAHNTVYKLGFDRGVMTAGPFKGQPVKKAKLEMQSKMVEAKEALIYSEPEKKVVGRSGDECVVAIEEDGRRGHARSVWRGGGQGCSGL